MSRSTFRSTFRRATSSARTGARNVSDHARASYRTYRPFAPQIAKGIARDLARDPAVWRFLGRQANRIGAVRRGVRTVSRTRIGRQVIRAAKSPYGRATGQSLKGAYQIYSGVSGLKAAGYLGKLRRGYLPGSFKARGLRTLGIMTTVGSVLDLADGTRNLAQGTRGQWRAIGKAFGRSQKGHAFYGNQYVQMAGRAGARAKRFAARNRGRFGIAGAAAAGAYGAYRGMARTTGRSTSTALVRSTQYMRVARGVRIR